MTRGSVLSCWGVNIPHKLGQFPGFSWPGCLHYQSISRQGYWLWKNSSFSSINTLRPRQNVRHFANDTFKRIFLNENVRISIKISLKFVPKGPINNIPTLVQIMAWRQPGNKPLSEPMLVSLLVHICVTRPQWVKKDFNYLRHLSWEKWQKTWNFKRIFKISKTLWNCSLVVLRDSLA